MNTRVLITAGADPLRRGGCRRSPGAETRERCRRLAERYFDLDAVGGERYWAFYRALDGRD